MTTDRGRSTAVAAGSAHTVALKSEGTLWTWGDNGSGQLGDGGTTFQRTSPAQVGTGTDCWQVAGVGDFDGDGKSDILWRNSSTGENYVYFMNGLSIVNEGYLRTVADQNWQVAGVACPIG